MHQKDALGRGVRTPSEQCWSRAKCAQSVAYVDFKLERLNLSEIEWFCGFIRH